MKTFDQAKISLKSPPTGSFISALLQLKPCSHFVFSPQLSHVISSIFKESLQNSSLVYSYTQHLGSRACQQLSGLFQQGSKWNLSLRFFLLLLLFFKLEYNCFTILCFSFYSTTKQIQYMYTYIPPLPSWTSLSHTPPRPRIPPIWVITDHQAELLDYIAASHQLPVC